ncbi:MAG: HAMP domain-containing sensor histidine kinase [Planctomycetota bacterium]|nr:HAMP domain-containing sensor histidine kinase [Planctomycetota bacterium]
MRIAILVPDPLLRRALVDLLRSQGHQVRRLDAEMHGCQLRIVSGEVPPAPPGCATLLLRRGGPHAAHLDPPAALRAALASAGTAVWESPLDTALLADALAEDTAKAWPTPALVPDLGSAPHPWIVTDPSVETVVAANAEAAALFRLASPDARVRLDDMPLGPRVRDALRESSEGLRTTHAGGEAHLAAWWTDEKGRRVVCFLPAPSVGRPTDRAERSLADLGRMAATLAHEIRNPVASLAGALELLEHEDDPQERDEIFGMARERLRQLTRLLEKTLTLARPIEGAAEAIELQPVIASAVSTMRLDPMFADVSLEVEAPPEIVRVRGLQGPLLQALLNLLLNAAQAQDGHGAVRIGLSLDRGRALLRITDDGPGIPAEKRDQVFKPFYTTRPAGTGLGLSEVRRCIEAFDGEVEILDVPRGACFQLVLPLAPAPTA